MMKEYRVQAVCMCIFAMEAQGKIRPRKRSGMLSNPSGTTSHDENLDLQCGHCSSRMLIEVDKIPVFFQSQTSGILVKLEFEKVSGLQPKPSAGG